MADAARGRAARAARAGDRARRPVEAAAAGSAADLDARLRGRLSPGARGWRRLLRLRGGQPHRGRTGAGRHLGEGDLSGAADGQPAGQPARALRAGAARSRAPARMREPHVLRLDGGQPLRHALLRALRRLDARAHVCQLRPPAARPAAPTAASSASGVTAGVIGLFTPWECCTSTVNLAAGDTLVVFTDGASEATSDSGEEFREDRLLAVIREHRDAAGRSAAADHRRGSRRPRRR